jgi:prepilin peptidase CpaA
MAPIMHVLLQTLALLFPALMAYAAASDLLTMKIPNRLVIGLAVAFFVSAAWVGLGWSALGLHVAVAAGTLVLCFGMFAAGWIGGGDAKLAAATALWFGPTPALVNYFVIAAIAGGALGLFMLAVRQVPLPAFTLSWEWLQRLHDRKTGVPYGVTLAGAALVAYAESPVALALASGQIWIPVMGN